MLRTASRSILPPIVFGALFLLGWQMFVQIKDIPSFILPSPGAIWSAFGNDRSRILTAARNTGLNALIGLVGGTVVAVVFASLIVRIRTLDEMLTPLVAALATIPIVALAPLLNIMFPSTSALPRQIVVGVSAFVPLFMNVVRGLKQISAVHAELMASYAVSGWAVLRTIRIPGALPFFFTGLRIAASLSVIAAVVTEYFGGLQNGLGSRITSAVAATNYPRAWASVLGAVLLGLLFYMVALLLERLVMRGRVQSG